MKDEFYFSERKTRCKCKGLRRRTWRYMCSFSTTRCIILNLNLFCFYNIPNGVLSSFSGGEKQGGRGGERDSLFLCKNGIKKCEVSVNKNWGDIVQCSEATNVSRTGSTVTSCGTANQQGQVSLNRGLWPSQHRIKPPLGSSCLEITVHLREAF